MTVQDCAFGRICLESVFAGKADLATVAQMPVVMNSFRRDDFAVVASFAYNYDDSKIIVRKASGIRTAADLKGGRIGVPAGTSVHYFLDVFLNYHGIDAASVRKSFIPAQDLPPPDL